MSWQLYFFATCAESEHPCAEVVLLFDAVSFASSTKEYIYE